MGQLRQVGMGGWLRQSVSGGVAGWGELTEGRWQEWGG